MGTWQFDPLHTQVEFAAKHLGMMTVRGHFTDVKATGHIDPAHPEDSSVDVVVQMESIRTHNEQRDNDLRGSNILEIDKYPTMTFKSTGIKSIGGDRYELTEGSHNQGQHKAGHFRGHQPRRVQRPDDGPSHRLQRRGQDQSEGLMG
jgi:polyisoprenoid-binding protein YceI